MHDGEQFLIGHRFDDADSQHQPQAHREPVRAIQPVHVLNPPKEQMLHVGCRRQQQQSPAKPFFQIFLQFLIERMQAEDTLQDEAKDRDRDQAQNQACEGLQNDAKQTSQRTDFLERQTSLPKSDCSSECE